MAAFVGRNIAFTWNGNSIAGVRSKALSLNGAPINVTSGEDAGKRQLLTVSAEDEVNITIQGVSKDRYLQDDWFAGNRTRTGVMTFPDGTIISGSFFLASFAPTGTYNDATTFQAELQLTGNWSYTPGS
jgi:predicted secreted protein